MNETRREPPCLSDLKLDQLLSGELPPELAEVARAHIEQCARCEERQGALAAERAAFAVHAPRFEDMRARLGAQGSPVPLRKGPSRTPLWAGALALSAALVALGVGLGRLDTTEQLGTESAGRADSTRTKGSGPVLGFAVKRGGQTFWGESGRVLHPGDELRFTVSAEQPSYVGVWGIDVLGRTSAYHSGSELAKVAAGIRQPLPHAVQLDDSLGAERLVAVFCSHPVAAAELHAVISGRSEAPSLPSGCSFDSLSIVKALP